MDDFLTAGMPTDPLYVKAQEHLRSSFRFGKWSLASKGFTFAGCFIKQTPQGIVMDQEEYIREWVKEIPISRERLRQSKAPATKAEVAALRGALGIIASQTGPQYQAEVSLLLSRVPTATVNTFDDVNKLIREVRRTATQKVLCMGEDACFLLRALWMEIHGVPISRASLKSDIANCTRGALITTLEEFMMP